MLNIGVRAQKNKIKLKSDNFWRLNIGVRAQKNQIMLKSDNFWRLNIGRIFWAK